MARDSRWERFKRRLRAHSGSELEDDAHHELDRRDLLGGHDEHSHSKGGLGHLEARDYGAFVDHRPPYLGPSTSSNLMRGVRTQPPPREGRPAFRAVRSDERIREDVSEMMTREGWLDASDLVVRVEEQRVTLEGTVPDREQKWLAEECAEHVLGVVSVVNRIRIRREPLPHENGRRKVGDGRENGKRAR